MISVDASLRARRNKDELDNVELRGGRGRGFHGCSSESPAPTQERRPGRRKRPTRSLSKSSQPRRAPAMVMMSATMPCPCPARGATPGEAHGLAAESRLGPGKVVLDPAALGGRCRRKCPHHEWEGWISQDQAGAALGEDCCLGAAAHVAVMFVRTAARRDRPRRSGYRPLPDRTSPRGTVTGPPTRWSGLVGARARARQPAEGSRPACDVPQRALSRAARLAGPHTRSHCAWCLTKRSLDLGGPIRCAGVGERGVWAAEGGARPRDRTAEAA